MNLHRPALLIAVALLGLGACSSSAPPTKGAPPVVRLLSESQYRSVIADVFGAQIAVGGTFDPLVRTNGLLTVGTAKAGITPAGLEQFDRMARSIAAQVLSEANRDAFLDCAPQPAAAFDTGCATRFFGSVGRLLFRRPLTAEELKSSVEIAGRAARDIGDFHEGIAAGLEGLLVSPAFLFVIDNTEPDPQAQGKQRLDAWSKASRLSFFLWGTSPDDALLAAAERGELHSKRGLEQQVDRMLQSPKLEAGMRAFFNDMFAFEDLARLEKDSIIYPSFSAAVATDAREQTLRTVVDHLLVQRADYRDLFTTRKTFISGPLGRIYRLPAQRPDGGWTSYEFPEGDPRAGLITQASFNALYAHPGRSSPTLRGRAIRELLLCQKVPDPPGNVDFSLFNDPNAPSRTARQRLGVHATQPACAGCHKLTDPIGLALEKIDGAGQLRETESNTPIDTSGDLDGKPFSDAAGLGKAMRDNPATPACVVNRVFSYAAVRTPQRDEKKLLEYFETEFAKKDYLFPELLRQVAASDALYAVTPAPTVRSAALNAGKDAAQEDRS